MITLRTIVLLGVFLRLMATNRPWPAIFVMACVVF